MGGVVAGSLADLYRVLFERGLAAAGSGASIVEPVRINGVTAECLTAWPSDRQLLAEWDELSRAVPSATVFHSPLWQECVWRHLPSAGRLRLILVRQGSRLVAALPLHHKRQIGLEVPAPTITDYLDPLILPAARVEAWQCILKLLADMWDRRTHAAAFHNVRDDAAICTVLPPLAKQAGFAVEQTVIESVPYVPLPPTMDQWLGRLHAHERKELRRKIHKAETRGNARLAVVKGEQIQPMLQRFVHLMQHRGGQKAEDVRQVLGPIVRCAGPELIRRSRMQLSTLMINDEPTACLLESPGEHGPMLYNSGFDTTRKQWSPGVVAIALSIRRAIDNGATIYDFLRGEEEYKFKLGAVRRSLTRLTLRRN